MNPPKEGNMFTTGWNVGMASLETTCGGTPTTAATVAFYET